MQQYCDLHLCACADVTWDSRPLVNSEPTSLAVRMLLEMLLRHVRIY